MVSLRYVCQIDSCMQMTILTISDMFHHNRLFPPMLSTENALTKRKDNLKINEFPTFTYPRFFGQGNKHVFCQALTDKQTIVVFLFCCCDKQIMTSLSMSVDIEWIQIRWRYVAGRPQKKHERYSVTLIDQFCFVSQKI